MNPPLFIIFDGLDCVGKTTTAKALAEELRCKYVPWMQEPFRSAIHQIWKDDGVSENSAHLVFLAALRHLSEQIQESLSSGVSVVSDRYIFSSIAVHAPLSLISGEPPIIIDYKKLDLLKPNFAFLLKLDESERLNRICKRGSAKSPSEILCEKDPKFLDMVNNAFEVQVQGGELIALNVNSLSTDAIVDTVRRTFLV